MEVRGGSGGGGGAGAAAGGDDGAPPATTLLPAGHEVMLLLHALHHDPAAWGEDAHVWEPERWEAGSPYWQRRQAAGEALPPAATFPSRLPDSFYPFLEGTRRCAGMLLAQLEFAVMLHVFLVVYDTRAVLPSAVGAAVAASVAAGGKGGARGAAPAAMDAPPALAAVPTGIGGGIALGAGTLLQRPAPGNALAAIADPRAVASGGARVHIVLRPDMFTTVDGDIPYTFGMRAF